MAGSYRGAASIPAPASDESHSHRGAERRLRTTWALIQSDLYRYAGNVGLKALLRHFLFTPGFKYSAVMRLCGYLRGSRLAKWTIYPPLKLLLLRYRYKYGIAIPEYTRIGPGLFINRFGGVMINGDAVIGANCNITHGAMLGQLNRGPHAGSPIVGDEVFLAAGCKVLGRIRLGDRAAVGANAVVTKDVPDDGVVGGIPARLISAKGSAGYINRRVWPDVSAGFRPWPQK